MTDQECLDAMAAGEVVLVKCLTKNLTGRDNSVELNVKILRHFVRDGRGLFTATTTTEPAWEVDTESFYFSRLESKQTQNLDRYPHRCPKCDARAFVGLNQIDCLNPRCPGD